MEKINAAVIGLGIMGVNHARVFSEMSNASLVAVCDSDREVSKDIAKRFAAAHYFDYKEMIKKERLDAVSICVPTVLHKNVAIDVIKNKINALVEKPIAVTMDEAAEIISEAEKANAKLMVGHIERFNPVVMELKKRIANNELGNIYKVHCARQSQLPKRVIDVGVIIDLAIHEIDILSYIINSKIKRVFAETARRVHSSHEDLLIGTLRFENNVLGVINANWLTPKKVREITVTGEKGMFVANYLTQELDFYEKEFAHKDFDYSSIIKGTEAKRQRIYVEKKEPLRNELESFAKCIVNNTKPLVTGEDGLRALEIAQKFLESSKRNEVICI